MTQDGATAQVRPLRRDAAENRRRVLDAANQIFAERGLAAGVEEVAQRAGVGMGTVYRRFPSKQALIDALVGDLRLQVLALAEAAAAAGRADGTGLETFLVTAGDLQAAQPACLQRIWRDSAAEADAVLRLRELVAEMLATAKQHGRIRSDAVATDITLVMLSVVSIISSTEGHAPGAWRRHLELLLAGLRPDRGSATLQAEPLDARAVAEITGLGGEPAH